MRTRIWSSLANIKFKAMYTNMCSRRAELAGQFCSFVLAVTSASSVTAWAIWESLPGLWASIVAVAQVLHVGRPHLPFMKHDKGFLEMSFEFEALYLELEKLWFEFENERVTAEEAEQRFYELRAREIEIERTHKEVHCPRFKSWIVQTQRETEKALALNFYVGEEDG